MAVLCGSCGSWTDRSSVTADRRPNILLIVVDTLRADRLRAYGFSKPTSPHLDELARSGLRLDHYTTSAPSTLASFTSMLTGRYVHTHGVFRNGVAWPDGLQGVQSELQASGYTTAAFIASYCLSSEFGLDRGFDHFDENLTIAMDDLPLNRLIRRGAEVTEAVWTWLDNAAGRGRPFFAMVHYFDPHWPYQPPPPYDTMFGPGYEGPVTGSMQDLRALRQRLGRSGGRPDADSRRLHDLHLGEIRYTDEQIGRLVEQLNESGLAERTLVLVTADHGETFWDHYDYFSHGLTVYDSNIRIPFIASGPGIVGGGRVIETSLSNVDLAPTLLEYAGIEPPPGYEGKSFLPLLRGEVATADARRSDVFSEATRPHLVENNQTWPNRLKARCIIRAEKKLMLTPWRGDLYELYDRSLDPAETDNLWAGAAGVALAGQLAADLERWSGHASEIAHDEQAIDPEVLERLRSLGYVE